MTWRYQAAGKLPRQTERSKALMPSAADQKTSDAADEDILDLGKSAIIEIGDSDDQKPGTVTSKMPGSIKEPVAKQGTAPDTSAADNQVKPVVALSAGAADKDNGSLKEKVASRLHDGGNMIDLETLQSRVEAAKRRRGQAGEQLRRERERLRKLLDLTERRFAEMRTIVARYEEDNRRVLRENEQLRSMLNAVLSVEEDDSFSEEMGSLVSRLGTIVSDEPTTAAAAPKPAPSLDPAPIPRREDPVIAPAAAATAAAAPVAEAAKVATVSVAKTETQPEPAPAPEAATASAEEAIEVVDIADAKARITEALAAVDRGDEGNQQSRRGGFGFFRRGNEEKVTEEPAEKAAADDSNSMANEFADVLAELERSETETQRDSDSFQYNLRPGPRSGS